MTGYAALYSLGAEELSPIGGPLPSPSGAGCASSSHWTVLFQLEGMRGQRMIVRLDLKCLNPAQHITKIGYLGYL